MPIFWAWTCRATALTHALTSTPSQVRPHKYAHVPPRAGCRRQGYFHQDPGRQGRLDARLRLVETPTRVMLGAVANFGL